jgi:acetyl-CoA acetyltransferase
VQAGKEALRQAEIGREDIDALQIYDSFTYTVLVTLEDYGFCAKGEGGPFVADGRLGVGGSLPCNTGGGQLSAYYAWGFTPLSEGVVQARGTAGERQVPNCNHVMVSGSGGFLNYHSTIILSRDQGSGRAEPAGE